MFYLIIADNGTWARGDTLTEVFSHLFMHSAGRIPNQGILYEYEADDPLKMWVDDLGWAHSAADVDVISEKQFDPRKLFQLHHALECEMEEIAYG